MDAPRLSAFDLLCSAVLLLDADGRVCYANGEAEQLFNISRRRLHHLSLSQLLGERHGLDNAIQQALNSTWRYSRQHLRLKRPHAIVQQLECTVCRLEQDPEYAVLLEFRPIDAQLQASHEEQQQQQRLAQQALLNNLAHEINNPLGGIRGAAQLLSRQLAQQDLQEYTDVIIAEVDRLQHLLQRVLSSAKTASLQAVNIHDVLEHVRKLICHEFTAIIIKRDYDTSLPELHADRDRLIQAIFNVVRNAAQALQGEGTIQLTTRIARQVTLGKQRHVMAICLQIRDNGPGIPASNIDQIFYPLFSTNPRGNGLGLSLTQQIIEQHHGTIQADSEPGHTCFTLMLPLRQAATAMSVPVINTDDYMTK